MEISTIGHIEDAEFADLNLVETDENEVQRLTTHGLPIDLPWGRKEIRLGTCFHSNRQKTGDPWSKTTPFVLSDIYMISKLLRADYGTNSTARITKTSRTCETRDHLAFGLGVGVGLPFLASVSVKGQFENDVQDNKDSEKTSIRSTVRSGTIEFERQPRLTKQAIAEIKYGGGYEGFCERYGDYYVSGYRLGGDTGILVSASGHSRKEVDKYSITVSVEILFFEFSETWSKEFESFTSGRSVKMLGYDTLEGLNWKSYTATGGDIKAMREWAGNVPPIDMHTLTVQAEQVIVRSQNLAERIGLVLEKHGFVDGQELTFDQCEALVREGVVVELILTPMSRLRDVIEWVIEDDVI